MQSEFSFECNASKQRWKRQDFPKPTEVELQWVRFWLDFIYPNLPFCVAKRIYNSLMFIGSFIGVAPLQK